MIESPWLPEDYRVARQVATWAALIIGGLAALAAVVIAEVL